MRLIKREAKLLSIEYNQDFDAILELLYRIDNSFAWYRYSPNRQYIAAWSRASYCILHIATNKYIFNTDGTCIEDVKVANNGCFVVEDWLDSQTLSGRICFGMLGTNLLAHRDFPANIFETDLSVDGDWFAVQLCRCDDENYSNKRLACDLKQMKWRSIRRKI